MGKIQESVIYVTKEYWSISDATYEVYSEAPFSKQMLREYMTTGKNIIINSLTPELEQIIRYNNGYLKHKYDIRRLS